MTQLVIRFNPFEFGCMPQADWLSQTAKGRPGAAFDLHFRSGAYLEAAAPVT